LNVAVRGLVILSLIIVGTASAAENAPVYYLAAATPYRTVEAQTDEELKPGDLATVTGWWQAGGTTAGAVIECRVNEPAANKAHILAGPPVDLRYFYLDKWPEGSPPAGLTDWARAQGLVADAGLYHYGFIVRPSAVTPVAAPAFDEAKVRAFLQARRRDIRKAPLDRMTGKGHHPYNKGYDIVAAPAAAELAVDQADFNRGWAVVRARLERLPPQDSETLFRYLDLYIIMDDVTGDVEWAVLCVGGFFLE
jgi:hypothetical protein